MLAEGIIPARLDPKAPKRGKGQPPGSKNKKTLEREAALAREEKLTTETAPVQFELADASNDVPQKRGRGRPRGSKNKPKLPPGVEPPPKRGRGRPKGSKNKSKVVVGAPSIFT